MLMMIGVQEKKTTGVLLRTGGGKSLPKRLEETLVKDWREKEGGGDLSGNSSWGKAEQRATGLEYTR